MHMYWIINKYFIHSKIKMSHELFCLHICVSIILWNPQIFSTIIAWNLDARLQIKKISAGQEGETNRDIHIHMTPGQFCYWPPLPWLELHSLLVVWKTLLRCVFESLLRSNFAYELYNILSKVGILSFKILVNFPRRESDVIQLRHLT